MMVYFIVISSNLILKGFEITCLNNLILRNAVASCFFITFADYIAQTRHDWDFINYAIFILTSGHPHFC